MFIGERTTAFSSVNQEEKMYKEYFLGVANGSISGKVTFPEDFKVTARQYFFANCPNLTEVEFLATNASTTDLIATSQFIYMGCSNLRMVRFTNALYSTPQMVALLGGNVDLFLPKIIALNNTSFNRNSTSGILSVHIDKSCDDIKNMAGFPGCTSSSQFQFLQFVGTDGTLHHNGSEWVKL